MIKFVTLRINEKNNLEKEKNRVRKPEKRLLLGQEREDKGWNQFPEDND